MIIGGGTGLTDKRDYTSTKEAKLGPQERCPEEARQA